MLREVALRRALEAALLRRRGELDELQSRGTTLRRRLRELTDQLIATDAVRERFPGPEEPGGPAPPEIPAPTPSAPPRPAAEVPAMREAVPERVDPKLVLAPPPPPERVHAALLVALAERHPQGFTVGQLRDLLEETEPDRPHSYDAAWSLTNTLLRRQALELAGTKPGPAGPIRVFCVPQPVAPGPAAEVA